MGTHFNRVFSNFFLIISIFSSAFMHSNQKTNCIPVNVASQPLTRFTVVVSAEDDIPSAIVAKPARIPRITATPGKSTKSSLHLEFTVNSNLVRRINTQSSKYRVCTKKSKMNEWRPNTDQSPPCVTYLNLLVPIELEVPINIESIVEEPGAVSFDGPEKLFARTQNDYYHTQTAIGDPIRSKRKKRVPTNEFFGDTESMVRKIVRAIWHTQ